MLSGGLAHILADLGPRFPGAAWCRVLTLTLNALLFSAVLWAGYVLQAMVEAGGWAIGRIALMDMLTTGPVLAIEVLLALAAGTALALRPPASTRPWQLEDVAPQPWTTVRRPGLVATLGTGVLGGLAATAVVVTYRLARGPAPSDAATWDRFEGFQWAIAVAAAVVGVVLVVRDPHRGPGAAMLAVPVAAMTGVVGYLTLNTALGGDLPPSFVWLVARPTLVLACYMLWAVATPAYAVGRAVSVPTRSGRAGTAVVVATTVLLTTGAAVAAVAGRAHLVGYNPFTSPDLVTRTSTDPVAAYRAEVMLPLSRSYQALSDHGAEIDGLAVDAATRAARMESEVVGPVRALRQQWADPHTDAPALVEAHRAALEALDAAAEKYRTAALGYLATDPTSADAARAEVARLAAVEQAAWDRWIAEVSAASGAGS